MHWRRWSGVVDAAATRAPPVVVRGKSERRARGRNAAHHLGTSAKPQLKRRNTHGRWRVSGGSRNRPPGPKAPATGAGTHRADTAEGLRTRAARCRAGPQTSSGARAFVRAPATLHTRSAGAPTACCCSMLRALQQIFRDFPLHDACLAATARDGRRYALAAIGALTGDRLSCTSRAVTSLMFLPTQDGLLAGRHAAPTRGLNYSSF